MNSEANSAKALARAPSLERLLALTDTVQEAINAGDWQNAAVAETERRAMLEAYLEQERANNGDLAHLTEALAGLQTRSHRLIGELAHHRRRLEQKVCELGRGRRAVNAYLDFERNTPGT